MKKKEDGRYNTLLLFCEKNGAQILSYIHYKKFFGDFVVRIKYKGKEHTVITDRGDIYLDSRLIHNGDYHIAGRADTFSTMLDVLQENLFRKATSLD